MSGWYSLTVSTTFRRPPREGGLLLITRLNHESKALARAVLGVALVEHLPILYFFLAPVPEHHDCMTAHIGFLLGLFFAVLGSVNGIAAWVTYVTLKKALYDSDTALLWAAGVMAAAPVILLGTEHLSELFGQGGLLAPFYPYVLIAILVGRRLHPRICALLLMGALLATVPAFMQRRPYWVAKYHGAKADLRGASLAEKDLGEADLRGAGLRSADLRRAQLPGRKLWWATLDGANLEGAELQRAELWDAHLRGAKLEGASLERADLRGADLRGADLRRADLESAQLEGAHVRGARLEGVNLLRIYYDRGTRWPSHFDPQEAGALPSDQR
jgi:hypothetical protein